MSLEACGKNVRFSTIFVLPSALAGGVTWLVSSISNPLATATIAAVSAVAAYTIDEQIQPEDCLNEWKEAFVLGSTIILPIALSLASTAIGFPVSIPLSLLVGVMTLLGAAIGMKINDC